jgi:microcystin-dependent protein
MDVSGVSPFGFTTFVRPSQIPEVRARNSNVTVFKVKRNLTDTGDTDAGTGIEDYEIDFTVPPVQDLNDLTLANDVTVKSVTGTAPAYTVVDTLYPSTTDMQTFVNGLVANVNTHAVKLKELADLFVAQASAIDIGDIIYTAAPPSTWGTGFLEANGAEVSQSAYPALYAKYGNTYGVASALHFRLPDYTNTFLKGTPTVSGPAFGSGGSNTATINIAETNLPAHKHGINLSTSSNGDHQHTIPLTEDANTDGTPAKGTLGGPAGTAYTDGAGTHFHTVTGDTANTGSGTPIGINTQPAHKLIYVKIKAL